MGRSYFTSGHGDLHDSVIFLRQIRYQIRTPHLELCILKKDASSNQDIFFLKTGLIVNRTHTMMKPNQMFRKKLLFRIKTFFIYRMKRNHYQILFLGFISYLFNIYMTYICTRTNRNCINFF